MPLSGIKVAEVGGEPSGAICAMHLGDLGADVIKIETVGGDRLRRQGPASLPDVRFNAWNRNKRSLVLDWHSEEGALALSRVLGQVDLVVDSTNLGPYSLPPGIVPGPRQIWCLLSARADGKREASGEVVVQSLTAMPSYLGKRGEPPLRIGVEVVTTAAGILAAQAVLAALIPWKREGIGQTVRVSLVGAALTMLNNYITSESNPDRKEAFASAPDNPPTYAFETADGMVDFVFYRNEKGWADFATWLGVPELAGDTRFSDYRQLPEHSELLHTLLAPCLRTRTAAEVLEKLRSLNALVAPRHTVETLVREPQVLDNNMLTPVAGDDGSRSYSLPSPPWRLGQTPAQIRRPPPQCGEQSAEILAECGFTPSEAAALANQSNGSPLGR